MPEGPEIRREADRIAAALVGQQVDDVYFGLPPLKRFARRLTGTQVIAVDTRGKALLTRFDNDLTMYSHNQLYGRWYVTAAGSLPRTNRQLRVALHTATQSALLYSASDIEILNPRQVAAHPFLSKLGPDILDATLTAEAITERLQETAFRSRSLGALYLDQGFLAGNGNYLRSEILWCAELSPWLKPAEVSVRGLKTLARETLRIGRRSYKTGGVVVSDRRVRELKAAGKTFQRYRFHAFGREGLPCYRCAEPIQRASVSSRNLFYCAICQPAD